MEENLYESIFSFYPRDTSPTAAVRDYAGSNLPIQGYAELLRLEKPANHKNTLILRRLVNRTTLQDASLDCVYADKSGLQMNTLLCFYWVDLLAALWSAICIIPRYIVIGYGMGLSFADALRNFPAADVKLIEETLMSWAKSDGLARDVVRNLRELEWFLPASNMAELLEAIRNCHAKTTNDLRSEYLKACYRNVKQGGPVRGPQPLLLGRAVEKEPFVQALFDTHGPINGGTGIIPDLPAARNFVSRLLSGTLDARERGLTMSKYAVWVTWNRSDSSSNPFVFSASATEIRACIGLESLVTKRGEPLLLLIYKKSPALELLRATVADAGLYKYYEPPPQGFEDYGLTKPWSEDFTPGFQPYPLPEAIHAAESFALLNSPVKEIV